MLLLLVSTISLGLASTLESISRSKKTLVQAFSTERYRGVAGTVKVTYSQVCADLNGRGQNR